MAKPLTIGYSSSGGSANPPNLSIKPNETIDVTVKDDCHVCFNKHNIFDDKQHRKAGSPYPWTPKPNVEGDATYHICAYDADCKDCKKPIENTYSIHVGS